MILLVNSACDYRKYLDKHIPQGLFVCTFNQLVKAIYSLVRNLNCSLNNYIYLYIKCPPLCFFSVPQLPCNDCNGIANNCIIIGILTTGVEKRQPTLLFKTSRLHYKKTLTVLKLFNETSQSGLSVFSNS